ncbi:MAG: helicase, partial [Muribaculaceae bacterium]|nr:helicase [Muribaculaceae bacterium]
MTVNDLQRQRLLLQLEYEHEREEFRRLTQAMGIGRRVKRGDCWWPATLGRSYYNSLNQLVVEVNRSPDEADVEHNFEHGRQVAFFDVSGTDDINYLDFSATVNYAESLRMVVIVPNEAAVAKLRGAQRLGVSLSFDETTHRLMMGALDRVIKARGNRLAELRDIFYHR